MQFDVRVLRNFSHVIVSPHYLLFLDVCNIRCAMCNKNDINISNKMQMPHVNITQSGF